MTKPHPSAPHFYLSESEEKPFCLPACRDFAQGRCSKGIQDKAVVRKDTKMCLERIWIWGWDYQRVTMTMGIMTWDFCLPWSTKCTCCLEGTTTPLRTIFTVSVIVVIVAIRFDRTLTSRWCFWVCPCSLCLLHLTTSNTITCGHTLEGIQWNFGSYQQN